jgi:hypothetical protein
MVSAADPAFDGVSPDDVDVAPAVHRAEVADDRMRPWGLRAGYCTHAQNGPNGQARAAWILKTYSRIRSGHGSGILRCLGGGFVTLCKWLIDGGVDQGQIATAAAVGEPDGRDDVDAEDGSTDC